MAAQWLRDEGDTSVFLDETGQEVRVAKSFAQPFMPPPSQGGEVAPQGAIDQAVPDFGLVGEPTAAPPPPAAAGPLAEMNFAPQTAAPGLFNVQTGAPAIPEGAEAPLPPAPEPSPEEVTAEPDIVNPAPPPPSIAPTGPLNTPTQVAGAVIGAKQEQAQSAYQQAEAGAAAADQIVQGSAGLDTELDRLEREKQHELQQRREDEAILKDDYRKKIDRYANWKADPNRGMSDGRQAAMYVMAAIAGIGSAMKGKGDQNPVLDMMKEQMAQRINLQMMERDQLGAQLALNKDVMADFRQGTQDRVAEFNLRMAGEMEKYGRLVDRVKTKLGSEVERESASQVSAGLKAEAAQLQGHAVAQEAQARAQARAARQAAVMKAAAQAENQRRWMAEHNIVGVDPKTGLYVQGATQLDAKEAALTDKAVADAQKAKLEVAPEERERTLGVGGLTQKGGAPVLAASVEDARELRKQKAAADFTTQTIDQLIALRKKHGWSSDLFNSPEFQQMKVNFGQLQLTKKDLDNLGALAGSDLDLVFQSLGTKDPTGVRDPTAGLVEARKSVVNKFNANLQAADPKAERYEPQKLAAREAVEGKTSANIQVALAPFNDLTKSDSNKLNSAKEARQAAFEEVARKGDAKSIILAGQGLQAQHALGEVDDETYKMLRAKLAARKLKLDVESATPFQKSQVIDQFGPRSGEDWSDRVLGGEQ